MACTLNGRGYNGRGQLPKTLGLRIAICMARINCAILDLCSAGVRAGERVAIWHLPDGRSQGPQMCVAVAGPVLAAVK